MDEKMYDVSIVSNVNHMSKFGCQCWLFWSNRIQVDGNQASNFKNENLLKSTFITKTLINHESQSFWVYPINNFNKINYIALNIAFKLNIIAYNDRLFMDYYSVILMGNWKLKGK